jgi:hypothetical protein
MRLIAVERREIFPLLGIEPRPLIPWAIGMLSYRQEGIICEKKKTWELHGTTKGNSKSEEEYYDKHK